MEFLLDLPPLQLKIMDEPRTECLRLRELSSDRYAALGCNKIVHDVRGNLLALKTDYIISTCLFDTKFEMKIPYRIT